jgi:hypothetical protein
MSREQSTFECGPLHHCGPLTTIRLFLATTHVATSVPHLVTLKVRAVDALGRFGFFAALRRGTVIAVLRM